MTVFPQELYQKIISLLENDSMALSHLALVDSKFRLMSQSLMWHTLRVETYRKSSRHPDGNLTSGDVQDLLSFLHEENSRCLLHLVSTAYIGVFSLVTLELVEEFGPIFTELVNLRLLKLYGEWSRMPIFLPSAIYSLLLEANTICPSMNVLCLQGVDIPILDIMAARPRIQHLSLHDFDYFTTQPNADLELTAVVNFRTALRSLTLGTYSPDNFGPSSPLLEFVRLAVSQNSFKALHIGTRADLDSSNESRTNLPLLCSTPLLEICAAHLTTLRLGYQLYHCFVANLLTEEDLNVLKLSNFISLRTLQFEILPLELHSRPNNDPIPFLVWLTAQIGGILKSQGSYQAFSYLQCDFLVTSDTEADVERILGGTAGWHRLDQVLAKESISIILCAGPDYWKLFDAPKDNIFPSCSANGLLKLMVSEEGPGGMYGINSAIFRA